MNDLSKPLLLQFAYKKEAEHFLQFWNAKIVHPDISYLYKSEKHNLYFLITQEGIENAILYTANALNYLSYETKTTPSLILNLGLAGSLCESINIQEIISPKKVTKTNTLNEKNDKAFSLEGIGKNLLSGFKTCENIATSDHRILRTEEKIKLLDFAEIVDRELWGVKKAAESFQCAVASLKIISDNANENSKLSNGDINLICKALFEKTNPYILQL